MGSLKLLIQYRPLLPWICSSLAIGYAAYLHWKLRRLKEDNKKKPINKEQDKLSPRQEVNIDAIDRNVTNKRVAYCRCWKSTTFPLCDGKHKYHNQDNDDKVGPLILTWSDTEPELRPLDASIIEHDKDMDIKSIDSESPILQSSNGDSNGEFEQMGKIGDTINTSSDEQLSSLEMIEEPDEREHKDENDDDFDEDTVKVEH